MVRPVSGVCDRVDSRPVPPSLGFVEGPALFFVFFGLFVFFAVGFGLALARCTSALPLPRVGAAFLGRLALAAIWRRFGADALLVVRLTAFFLLFFALPAGFLAI